MSTLNVAVVGARGVGASHVAALREINGVCVSVIAGATAESADAIARALRVPRAAADWREVVADDSIAAIHICTPNDLHFPIASAALEAGKHVICEKPLTADTAQARELADLAQRNPGQLSVVGYKYRYAPLLRLLRDQIRDGRLGRIHEIRGSYLQNWMLDQHRRSWRRDPGQGGRSRVLLDIGTHLLDLMETVLDQQLVSLQGHLFRAASPAGAPGDPPAPPAVSDDGAHVLLRFADGTRGVAALSQVSAAQTHQISVTVDGNTASARWSLDGREQLTISDAEDNATLRLAGDTPQLTAGRYWRGPGEPDRLLVPLLAAAYGCLTSSAAARGASPVPTPTFADGLRHVALIDTL